MSRRQSLLIIADDAPTRRSLADRAVNEINVIDRLDGVASTLSIDMIREIIRRAHRREDTDDGRRAIVIDDAHQLTLPAQHALLKILEEPPQGLWFVLTAERPDLILATIRSRLELSVHNGLDLNEFKRRLPKSLAHRADQLYVMTQGSLAQAEQIGQDEAIGTFYQSIINLLTQPLGEAAVAMEALAVKREDARMVARLFARVAYEKFKRAGEPSLQSIWLDRLQTALTAQERLRPAGVNAKLVLDALLIGFRQPAA